MNRTCPACGRTLTTRRNRFGVEMWPSHMFAAASKLGRDERHAIWHANRDREPGREDWKVPCDNSSQPVD